MGLVLPSFAVDFTYSYEGQTIAYTILDESAKTCKTKSGSFQGPGNNISGELTIPEKAVYNGIEYTVTTIGDFSFFECSGLTSVILPNSITRIEQRGFGECGALSSIDLGNSLSFIGAYGFNRTSSLKSIVLPPTVTNVGGFAFFYGSGLIKAAYPNTISNPFPTSCAASPYDPNDVLIENSIIYDAGKTSIIYVPIALTELTIPETVTSIGSSAFSGCTLIKSINSLAVEPPTMADNTFAKEILSSALVTVPDDSLDKYLSTNWSNFQTIGIGYYDGVLNYFLAPSKEGSEDIAIVIPGDYSKLTEILIPYRVNLTKKDGTTVRYNVERIGEDAFKNCDRLTSISFHSRSTVKNIENSAFEGTGISAIAIPASVENIGSKAFANIPSLNQITLNEGLIEIGASAFYNASDREAEAIYMPSTIKTIGSDAFFGLCCNKVEVSDLTPWYQIVFENEYSNPLSNGHILYLNDKEVNDLVIPENINKINSYAFYGCSGLRSITIPGNVTSIGENAFTSGSNIIFNYGASPIEVSANSFGTPQSLSCDRPLDGLPFDFSALETLKIGNTVETIPAYMFRNASNLSSLTLGSHLKSIGEEAFNGCVGLTEAVIPPTTETIGASAFAGCRNLATIAMGHSVKTIGENAFNGCAASSVSVTAQTPPAAFNNTFSFYTGKFYVQGENTVDLYLDATSCWDRFDPEAMTEATGMEISDKSISGYPGKTFQLTASLQPEGVTLPYIFWHSTNPDIASVDENGLVTILAEIPETDVTVTAEDDNDSNVDSSASPIKIIAESLYADGPVAEVEVKAVVAGIEDVVSDGSAEIDFTAPVEVYNLQGVKMAQAIDNLTKGIYIVRQGNNVKKIAVK